MPLELIGRETDPGIVLQAEAAAPLRLPIAAGRDVRPTAATEPAGQPGRVTNNAHVANETGNTTIAVPGESPRTYPPRAPGMATGSSRSGTVNTSGMKREVGPMSVTQTRGADMGPQGKRGPMTRVSRLTVPVLAAAFILGVAKGAVEYSHRSAILEPHVAGTNAITIHVILAIVAAAVVVTVQVRRSRKRSQRGPSEWTAPFSASTAARLTRTIRHSRGAAAVRLLPMALLILVLLYCPFRMGAQIVGGLDPNSTVNAWGGPTYVGAMLAHWLDCIVGFYACSFLLGRLLSRRTAEAERGASLRRQ